MPTPANRNRVWTNTRVSAFTVTPTYFTPTYLTPTYLTLFLGMLVGGSFLVSCTNTVFSAPQEPSQTRNRVSDETKAPDFSASQLEFFETEVRPILVERCFECHGPDSQELAGGLSLASRKDILIGGDSGAAIEPGDTTRSLLIEAVRYGDRVQMPPDQKMSLDEIATLMRWVDDQAPWPLEDDVRRKADTEFDLQGRRDSHWAWQAIDNPSLPKVNATDWQRQPLDRFILAKLEDKKLSPAADADLTTWLRRVTFDLSGLPPTAQQVQMFVKDMEDAAAVSNGSQALQATIRSKVVDRLLASPTFGERWARHWMDLVRYAETAGHEFDYPLLNASEYRDYVIRAFNSDVGYDRFVAEHIAGDLLPDPRENPEHHFNESQIATAFWYLGEANHAPVDVLGDEANRIDNQIDVFGKTFLGMTIACARCHDHKFDAISAQDYYSLAGILQSTRRDIGVLDEDKKVEANFRSTVDLNQVAAQLLLEQRQSWQDSPLGSDDFLGLLNAIDEEHSHKVANARRLDSLQELVTSDDSNDARQETGEEVDADDKPVLPDHLEEGPTGRFDRFVQKELSTDKLALDQKSPLRLLRSYASRSPEVSVQQWWNQFRQEILEEVKQAEVFRSQAILVSDFSRNSANDWKDTGWAFRRAVGSISTFSLQDNAWAVNNPETVDSGFLGPNFVGHLRSPTFEITAPRLHFRMKGNDAKVRLVIDSFRMNQFNGLLFGDCMVTHNSAGYTWRTLSGDIGKYLGHRAFIELIDDGGGQIAVDEIWMGGENPATAPSPLLTEICRQRETLDSTQALAEILLAVSGAYDSDTIGIPSFRPTAVQDSQEGQGNADEPNPTIRQRSFRESISGNLGVVKLVDVNGADRAAIQQWIRELRSELSPTDPGAIERNERLFSIANDVAIFQKQVFPTRTFYATTAGTPEDQAIYIRGNHKNLGTLAPRGLITALKPAEDSESSVVPWLNRDDVQGDESGRLRLANQVVSSSNPLTSRVLVNRVWHVLLGKGIVTSPDNFGVLGDLPTHPELLDHLATKFMQDQWSIKGLVRQIVLSRTYAMSSQSPDLSWQVDPKNSLLHCASVRRLEGEAIRDTMLWVSGRLDLKMYGPSVPTFVSDFMQGRGRPESGPLDGDNRRSVYLEVRRNFLNPFMLTFDTPIPFSTIGRRNQSNVPAQSLTMLNDPFVGLMAQAWAERVISKEGSDQQRLGQMYWDALGRPISEEELNRFLDFLQSTNDPTNGEINETQKWVAVAQAIFNLKEFTYLR